MFFVKMTLLVLLFGGLVLWGLVKRQQLRQFISEVQFEMTKVSWPTLDEVVHSTILVGIVTIALALLTFAADSVFGQIFRGVFGV